MATERTPQPVDTNKEMCRMQRIAVVGTAGSGKTTLAHQLGVLLGIPVVELDALHWEPDWTPALLPVFRERVEDALSSESWVVDGNYSNVRDLVWSRVDTVIWLDYSLRVIMARLTRRTFTRIFSGEELWNNNYESLGKTLFSKDSILLWALYSYGKNRRGYPKIISQPEYAHLNIVRHRSPQATSMWLAKTNW
jgi:hypothetical protein